MVAHRVGHSRALRFRRRDKSFRGRAKETVLPVVWRFSGTRRGRRSEGHCPSKQEIAPLYQEKSGASSGTASAQHRFSIGHQFTSAMDTTITKREILASLETLPDEATLDDVFERLVRLRTLEKNRGIPRSEAATNAGRVDGVRRKLSALGITETDVNEAVTWARRR